MEELTELKRQMTQQRPDRWDKLPDIPLYMDQVVSYLSRQMIPVGDGDALTSAMINNYIKDGLVERANGKKYGQEHLAYLTAITALKQVMSVREMKVLTTVGRELRTPERQYEYFCQYLDQAMEDAAERLDENTSAEDLPKLVLDLALRGYAYSLACHRALSVLAQHTGREDLLKKKR
ncbi:MAG: DUF1836 domain-containing protein [Oscillospiraceae bacterium]|nr:DUF1836 domain-containing protein [Oscillospiraceae bacterium]